MSEENTSTVRVQQENAVPALGRPFQLGMLYDCRTENVVTGLPLWDAETVKKETWSMPKESSTVRVIKKDDLDSKTNNININASITLKLLSGAIDITGSAKFIYDTVDSKEDSRIVLHYSSTSRVEQLMISKRLKEASEKRLKSHDEKMATHVVAGILYGADAFFVFDHKKKVDSSKIEVDGSLKATVKKIPKVTIEGSLRGGLTKEEREIAKDLTCKFYGDVILEPLPTTYSEALDAYRKLTTMIGAGRGKGKDKSVPMKVWLLPLTELHTSAPSFVKSMDDLASARAQHIVEDFELIKKEANDLKKRIGEKFQFLSFIQSRIDTAIATIEIRKTHLSTKLSKLLQEQTNEDLDLDALLSNMTAPPFDAEGIRNMFDDIEKEASTLTQLFSLIDPGSKTAGKSEPETILYSRCHVYLLS